MFGSYLENLGIRTPHAWAGLLSVQEKGLKTSAAGWGLEGGLGPRAALATPAPLSGPVLRQKWRVARGAAVMF